MVDPDKIPNTWICTLLLAQISSQSSIVDLDRLLIKWFFVLWLVQIVFQAPGCLHYNWPRCDWHDSLSLHFSKECGFVYLYMHVKTTWTVFRSSMALTYMYTVFPTVVRIWALSHIPLSQHPLYYFSRLLSGKFSSAPLSTLLTCKNTQLFYF